ncbi:unnamed protein product [Acanthoscelides obtectus]|uniref:Uncharacterized protein n=1 Tax=Acanthoscelides obtectus TaxID=200917 RepID=A0A9P0PLM8_ACAOB|nr:unnamed protein product [Acanthoscelides obtectus]CAK1622289.1 hypothetical protein AOBTE_LOCUS1415 [Acanthoscelides obtectus]
MTLLFFEVFSTNIYTYSTRLLAYPKRHFWMRQLLLLATGTFDHAVCF